MCPEIHPLSSGSQHRQERDGGGDGSPGAATAGPAPPAANQSDSPQHPHRAEDRRGGADRDVRPAADPGVQEVPASAGRQHQGAAEALAPAPAHRGEEEGAGDGVGQDVCEVGVQGERGDAAPHLAEENPRGIGAAPFEPDRSVAPGAGDREERQQSERDCDPRKRLAGAHGLGGSRGGAAVLQRVGGEDLRGPLLLVRGDTEEEHPVVAHHGRGETLGGQHQGPLVGDSAARRDARPARVALTRRVHLDLSTGVSPAARGIEISSPGSRRGCW